MAPFVIPSLDEIHAVLLADFAARFPKWDVARFSDNWKRLRILAGAVWGLHHQQKLELDEFFPDTASIVGLLRWGVLLNLPRTGATPSRKAKGLRVFGTAGTPITTGETLTATNGTQYQVNEDETVGASGFVDVDILAISVGTATRLTAPQELNFDSPPVGIDGTAQLQLDLDDGGLDVEDVEAYRVRILDRLARPAMGGNANDYKQWATDVDDIANAYVYPTRAGVGSVDVAVLSLGSGSVRTPSPTKITETQDYIHSIRPVAVRDLRVLTAVSVPQDIEVAVKTRPGIKWDWNDEQPLAVQAWTAATRTLQFQTDVPDDMEIGDRVIIKTAGGDGKPLEVVDFGASDEVILKSTPTAAPVLDDVVYAGGDVVEPMREATKASIDLLGPAIGEHGVGDWDDTIKPGRLEALAFTFSSIGNAETVVPANDVTPTDPSYPDDATTNYLAWSRVIVRRLHG